MEKNTLGEIIYHLRKKAGLTQEALAEGICSSISISRIENGKQMPSGKVLEQLLERLGTGTYQLCNVYYENECQASLRETLAEINAQVSAGDFVQARAALLQLSGEKMDPANLQHTKMLDAAIRIQDGTVDKHSKRCLAGQDSLLTKPCHTSQDSLSIETELVNALRLTKPDIDLKDCRSELFSPIEINLLVMLTTAKYLAGKNLEAIRIGEEVMFALDRNQSRLSDYKVLQINLAHNLGQILQAEGRFQEALLYARKAEKLSIGGTEQFMLPEIEFGIAKILSDMGNPRESRTRIEALIPYMQLIGKTKMADLAQDYLDKNLTNDVS